MWYPQNPKVLIVDDHYNEVEPLLRGFSLEGIPYVYFDASPSAVPIKPFSEIRLVILDIELDGRTFSGMDDNSIASTLASYLSQLIDIRNSCYAILFWTKRTSVIEPVLKYLKNANGSPITWKDMEKPAASDLTLEYVKEKFFSDLNSKSFEFLIQWETSIIQDASKFTNDISDIVNKDSTDWDASMKNILSKLAYSYTEKSESESLGENGIFSAINVLNRSFSESLTSSSIAPFLLPTAPSVSLTTISALNSILYIEKSRNDKIENGKIFYKENDEHLHYLLMHKILASQFRKFDKSSLIGVVLTPCCDIAHNKFLKDSLKREYHRILYGLKISINAETACFFEHNVCAVSNKEKIDKIIESEDEVIAEISKYYATTDPKGNINNSLPKVKDMRRNKSILKKIKKAIFARSPESLYITQPFLDESNTISLLAFHYGTLQTEAIDPQTIHFSYFMKNSVIADLQTKFANHVNRLGTDMIEFDIN